MLPVGVQNHGELRNTLPIDTAGKIEERLINLTIWMRGVPEFDIFNDYVSAVLRESKTGMPEVDAYISIQEKIATTCEDFVYKYGVATMFEIQQTMDPHVRGFRYDDLCEQMMCTYMGMANPTDALREATKFLNNQLREGNDSAETALYANLPNFSREYTRSRRVWITYRDLHNRICKNINKESSAARLFYVVLLFKFCMVQNSQFSHGQS